MVNLKINSIDIEAPEGSTILEAAKEAGFKIPALCHNDSLPHYSSCMVCMVRDNRSAGFLPSCSAVVQEGMDIDISGEDVISIRKKAVELLLSEHRAECEAPCNVVCPAGYNIPLMNRLLSARDYEAAMRLSITQIHSSEIKCIDCPGYCENACRRKKVDIPVSIRNMQLFISQQIKQTNTSVGSNPQLATVPEFPKGRFSSRIGKLETFELKEWLKECKDNITRVRDIIDRKSASYESESCMHCDCRAVGNCRLREIAEEFSIKDPRGKIVNSPIEKKININTGLVFENAKCIKCGLCVRLCEDSKDEPALCFINRGFISIIAEPLTEDFNNILKSKTKEVINICPTGALSLFSPPLGGKGGNKDSAALMA
jgi:predicted molibdopterin-dependent oxidoreductase YjgC